MRALRTLLLTLLALAATAEPRPAPRASIMPGGVVELIVPASILQGRQIRKQLSSGLTTAFVISATAAGGSGEIKGGARVEIRYEPWDEQFFVNTLEVDGRRGKATVDSWERLMTWWSQTPFRILRMGNENPHPPSIRARLEVLPFSAGEQDATRRWLSQPLGTSAQGEPDAGSLSKPAATLLDLIIGSSIQRRPILTYGWTVRLDRGAQP